MVLGNFGYELVFSHGFGEVIYAETLCCEDGHGFLADILQDQELQALIVYRMEDFGVSNIVATAEVDRDATVVSVSKAGTQRGGGGEDKVCVYCGGRRGRGSDGDWGGAHGG